MIRTSKHILKFQTNTKSNILNNIQNDFIIDLNFYIDEIISGKLPLKTNLSSKNLNGHIKHSQWKQILYKNASEIIRSQISKAQSKRYQKYKKLYAKCINANKHESFTNKKFSELKLKPIFQSKYFTKPNLKNITITLDNRVFDLSNNSKYFDEFIRLSTPYFHENKKRSIKICLPIKYHKHSLKFKTWKRCNSIRLIFKDKLKFIEIAYEKSEPEKLKSGIQLGIDQGYRKLLSCSNGKVYGTHLEEIYKRISKKKQGSNKFKKLLRFRSDETNRIINEFFKQNEQLRTLYIEDLKNVKRSSKLHRRVMNRVQRWLYSQVTSKLKRYCQENGIQLVKVNPAYTSQTCSKCGIVDKESRNGEIFHCLHCGYEMDADINAAKNIHRLGVMYPSIPKIN